MPYNLSRNIASNFPILVFKLSIHQRNHQIVKFGATFRGQVIVFDGQLKVAFMPVVVVIVSPFPPSDKIIVQKGNGYEEVIDMEKINMVLVLISTSHVISSTDQVVGCIDPKFSKFFDNPYKVDEWREQNSVDIVDSLKGLIEAGELPRDHKDAFKEFVREKVNEGKRANRIVVVFVRRRGLITSPELKHSGEVRTSGFVKSIVEVLYLKTKVGQHGRGWRRIVGSELKLRHNGLFLTLEALLSAARPEALINAARLK
ncbi:hypothetical protein E3N88_34765 [Mikania micrantha]|uniref:Uncharacterized protein n=1 Tax=Mikania micrantha TaxID=192012 RepID=A0A5N6LZ35_9ASTR|nr:hypothetical protein E3N88_34765 [Mikania micrantha]